MTTANLASFFDSSANRNVTMRQQALQDYRFLVNEQSVRTEGFFKDMVKGGEASESKIRTELRELQLDNQNQQNLEPEELVHRFEDPAPWHSPIPSTPAPATGGFANGSTNAAAATGLGAASPVTPARGFIFNGLTNSGLGVGLTDSAAATPTADRAPARAFGGASSTAQVPGLGAPPHGGLIFNGQMASATPTSHRAPALGGASSTGSTNAAAATANELGAARGFIFNGLMNSGLGVGSTDSAAATPTADWAPAPALGASAGILHPSANTPGWVTALRCRMGRTKPATVMGPCSLNGMGSSETGFLVETPEELEFGDNDEIDCLPTKIGKFPQQELAKDIVQICTGADSCFVVAKDGLFSWGHDGAVLCRSNMEDGKYLECLPVTEFLGASDDDIQIDRVACGGNCVLLLDKKGRVFFVGSIFDHSKGTGSECCPPGRPNDNSIKGISTLPFQLKLEEPAVAITAGESFCLIVLKSGNLLSFGTHLICSSVLFVCVIY
jgi:hypothetical protein